ncbi:MAG: DNA mismatch repair endonuclease MutL, partial [Anaerolineales bacterium]|nr:DNA mismatch repair endonuclease MutL [Anaerolineales bacterium]
MPILTLADEVVSQIAAGEVVERPASVVKELIENAIDAGSRDILVEVREGGKRLIRISDDGCGIPSSEADLAFQRHSTSKLRTADDLSHITTLGFRGEALASIAAVSRVTLVTHSKDEPAGTLLRLEGGQIVAHQSSGRPPGTTVTVEDLFFSVPARRKFLRSDQTEQRHIDACVSRYAMAYPDVRFTLNHEQGVVFQSPGNGRLRDVLIGVYGLEIGAAMLDLAADSGADPIQVAGLVSPPTLHRANRSYITLFVNGRWIQDSSLTYAVIQAYHTLLPSGRYPLGVIMVRLPPEDVDVNVHPTKAEVRFRDGDTVFRAVQRAVRRSVIEQSGVRPVAIGPSTWPTTYGPQRDAHEDRRERLASLKPQALGRQRQLELENERPPDSRLSAAQPPGQLPPLRVVGQLGATYIIAEGPEGMYLLDQHA